MSHTNTRNSITQYVDYTRQHPTARDFIWIRAYNRDPKLYHKHFDCDKNKAVELTKKFFLLEKKSGREEQVLEDGTDARIHLVSCMLMRLAARSVTERNPHKPDPNPGHEHMIRLLLDMYLRVNEAMDRHFGYRGIHSVANLPMWKTFEGEIEAVLWPTKNNTFLNWYGKTKKKLNTFANRVRDTKQP